MIPLKTIGFGVGHDYQLTGVDDHLVIRQAINDVALGAQTDFIFKAGGTPREVDIKGIVDIGNRRLRFFPEDVDLITFKAGARIEVLFRSQAYVDNLAFEAFTFDLNGMDTGAIHTQRTHGTKVRGNKFKNQGFGDGQNSRWTVRIGSYNDLDPEGTASHDLDFGNNYFEGNNCGTFEQVLLVNQQDYKAEWNRFKGNKNSLAYQLMLYINNKNATVRHNSCEDEQAHFIGIMESDGVDCMHNRQISTTGLGKFLTIINSKNVKVKKNEGLMDGTAAVVPFVHFFDREFGPDGWKQLIDNTCRIEIDDNDINGYKQAVAIDHAGFPYGAHTRYTQAQHDLLFGNNRIDNTVEVPMLIGNDSVENKLRSITILKNKIGSWGGRYAGALQLRGWQQNVRQMRDIDIIRNTITPSTQDNTSGIRVISAEVRNMFKNEVTGTGKIYSDISYALGGKSLVTR